MNHYFKFLSIKLILGCLLFGNIQLVHADSITSATSSIISDVDSISLPLSSSSLKTMRDLDKNARSLISSYKNSNARELDVINLYAELFEINFIIALDHIKIRSFGYKVKAGKDLGDSLIALGNVAHIFFKYPQQRYRVVWQKVGQRYRSIRAAYGVEVYNVIKGTVKLLKVLNEIDELISRA